MDNFDYKKYLKENRINQEPKVEDDKLLVERKKEGYDDREDESVSARKGKEADKKQSFKDRRDDSYGKFGKRDAEAKGKAKGPGKNKINKEGVDLNMEDDLSEVGKGYFKKNFGIGKKGFSMDKRKKLKETIIEIKAKMDEGSYPFDKCVADQEDQYGKEGAKRVCGSIRAAYGEGLEVKESAPGYTHDCAAHVMHESYGYGLCLEGRHTLVETTKGHAEVTHYDVMFKSGDIVEKIPVNELKVLTSEAHHHGKYEEDDIEENKRTDAEEEGYEDGFKDAKKDMKDALSKMKVSELKAEIRERIIDTLSEEDDIMSDPVMRHGEKGDDPAEKETEAMREPGDNAPAEASKAYYDIKEQEDVDVDVDIEDEAEIDVDAEGDDNNIKKTGVKADIEVGLSPVEELVQDSLQAAMKASEGLGDEVLTDQIGNTITYFTRKFVVGNRTD